VYSGRPIEQKPRKPSPGRSGHAGTVDGFRDCFRRNAIVVAKALSRRVAFVTRPKGFFRDVETTRAPVEPFVDEPAKKNEKLRAD